MNRNVFKRQAGVALLAALFIAGTASAAPDCNDEQCWLEQAATQRVEAGQAKLFPQGASPVATELETARSRRIDRLEYLARMAKGLERVKATVDRMFAGKLPEKAELARLTHDQVIKVKSMTPTLPRTVQRDARDARIRELTLSVRDAQTRSAADFKAAQQSADPEKATAALYERMRAEFTESNKELLALQESKQQELADLSKGDLLYQANRDLLSDLIGVGEYQDRKDLMDAARKQLRQDDADISALLAKASQPVTPVSQRAGSPH